MDVREGLHRMLGACTVASKNCLEMCIDKILENLKRYPQVRLLLVLEGFFKDVWVNVHFI